MKQADCILILIFFSMKEEMMKDKRCMQDLIPPLLEKCFYPEYKKGKIIVK